MSIYGRRRWLAPIFCSVPLIVDVGGSSCHVASRICWPVLASHLDTALTATESCPDLDGSRWPRQRLPSPVACQAYPTASACDGLASADRFFHPVQSDAEATWIWAWRRFHSPDLLAHGLSPTLFGFVIWLLPIPSSPSPHGPESGKAGEGVWVQSLG